MICENCILRDVAGDQDVCSITSQDVTLRHECHLTKELRYAVTSERMATRMELDGWHTEVLSDIIAHLYEELAACANSSLTSQIEELFKHHDDEAMEIIVAAIEAAEEKRTMECDAVIPLATRGEYSLAITALNDAVGDPDSDPGLHKALMLLSIAREKQYPEG